ncbi:Leucine-rich repeat-containing protein 23 [Gaertneriomyces sp. JEL0708]|nr:Leucine-rich repeat-containing protein 23 [Gaertneriomyces sp. JEL0708]
MSDTGSPPSEVDHEKDSPERALDQALIAPHLSLLARTGNGLSHAFTRLELHDAGVTDIAALEKYIHLRYIDLSLNAVKDITPLAPLDYLLSLDMHSNMLMKVPKVLDRKKYLQFVNLARNQIEDMEIEEWPMCGWLNLNENRMSAVKLSLPSLLHLEARSNAITTVALTAPKLQKLYLGNNRFRSLSDIGMQATTLQILHLRDNQIRSLKMRETWAGGKIIYLNLRGNALERMSEVNNLRDLGIKILVLMDNPIADNPNYRMEILSRLPDLERLDKDVVTDEEREEAEAYRREHADQLEQADEPPPEDHLEGVDADPAPEEQDKVQPNEEEEADENSDISDEEA